MLDTFNSNNDTSFDNDFQETNNNIIEIWVETYGRKKNTYISGWNVDLTNLKQHLTFIKKKNGCNGSIKNNVLHLQGDHIDFMTKYLVDNGCDKNNLVVKG